MLLDTIRCSTPGCSAEFTEDVPRWHLLLFARDAGWTFSEDDEEKCWCPEHAEDHDPLGLEELWVVGCFTCDFEEDFTSEEDARYEYDNHECEADTWIHDPEKVRETEARRVAKRSVQTARVNAALSETAERQQQIETYARRWLRLRNLFLFWKREHIIHP